MQFRTLDLVKHEMEKVWASMRDDLPKLADMMEDVESITEEERFESPPVVHVVNIWKCAMSLPNSLRMFVDSGVFIWTDRGEWNNETHVCKWTIEVHNFRDSVECHGKTVFEPAMGGNGTKITFSGDLELNSQKLAGITGFLGATVLLMAEDIIHHAIQKNFRNITKTIAKYMTTP
jgi:hypothetical protein